MLDIRQLYASAGEKKILKGIDLLVQAGEFHLILGVNGSGKSTLGKVLLGSYEYQVDSGNIFFENEEITNAPTFERAQKGIFLSHQTPPSLEGISAKDFLRAAEKENPNSKKRSILEFKKQLGQTLEEVGLGKPFLERHVNVGASGGERKKMEMVSLIMLHSKLAFLDEIDSGVDIDAIKAIAKGVEHFLSSKENALILVSHSDALLKHVSPTHVHIFEDGKIKKSGGKELAKQIHEEGF